MTDALVEAVALATLRAEYGLPEATPDGMFIAMHRHRNNATAALQAIEAAGYRVVPVEAAENAERLKKASQTWQDIDSAPTDGTDFLAAVMMVGDDGRRWWEQHVIYVDQETSEIAQDVERGVDLSDYHCWMPLPPNPGEVAGGQA